MGDSTIIDLFRGLNDFEKADFNGVPCCTMYYRDRVHQQSGKRVLQNQINNIGEVTVSNDEAIYETNA